RRYRGCTLGYDYAALTGSKFRYADAPQTTPQIPIYRAPYSNFGTRVGCAWLLPVCRFQCRNEI
ncbi:MAG: hypothetical protein IJX33_10110, partial [Akkermansia sp.]|nr:hypothetical protein [Akkermansia sp.]